MTAPPKIKGAAVREFLRWYAQSVSPEQLHAVIGTMPAPLRTLFDPDDEAMGVLPSSWYDARAVAALIDALFATIPPEQQPAFVRAGARFAVDQSARGIYRFVVERLSPQLYVRQIQRLWRMLHDNGEREMVMTSDTSCVSYTRDWPGHHPILCLATVETMAAVFEIMGCREVQATRIACVSQGAPECVAELQWKDG